MVRGPLTVGTRVKVTLYLGPNAAETYRYGVVEAVIPTNGRCVTHPTDLYAYQVALVSGGRAAYCDSQCTEV